MQEIQERPKAGDEGNEGVWGGAPPRTPISESANQLGAPWSAKEIQERPCGAMGGSFRENGEARNGGRRARSAAKPQSDRWSPKRFAPTLASLRLPFSDVLL